MSVASGAFIGRAGAQTRRRGGAERAGRHGRMGNGGRAWHDGDSEKERLCRSVLCCANGVWEAEMVGSAVQWQMYLGGGERAY